MSTLVLDIGRSHAKVCVFDTQGGIVCRQETGNETLLENAVPVFNCERLWRWFLTAASEFSQYNIKAISVSTHGAAAALLDSGGELIGVMDYESEVYGEVSEAYNRLRDRFSETGSPLLGSGLNLGRQLFWLQQSHPDIFARVDCILPYPQYWAYRLSGIKACEITSLGTHSDLWNITNNDFSHLVDKCRWRHLFPPMRHAWDVLGPLRKEISELTNIKPGCEVLCGIHDSNASFACHYQPGHALTLLSTGTWVIGMKAATTPLETPLVESNDELVNINLLGEAVPSFRFMGGREWQALCGNIRQTPDESTLDEVIRSAAMALPAFSSQGGPFAHRRGEIIGSLASDQHRKALASLYCTQVTSWCLQRFGCKGNVIIDGPFIFDEIYLQCLASLVPQCNFSISDSSDGTARGAARLAQWPKSFPLSRKQVRKIDIPGLTDYHAHWLAWVGDNS